MTDQSKPLALVTGVGPGTGAAVARRFADSGYRVAMLARDAERLRKNPLGIFVNAINWSRESAQ